MKRDAIESLPPDVESLLEHERVIESFPDDVRRRILERARRAPTSLMASTRLGAFRSFSALPRVRGANLFAAAAMCLLLFALGAAAFYRARAGRGMPASPAGPIDPSPLGAVVATEERPVSSAYAAIDPDSETAVPTEARPSGSFAPLERPSRASEQGGGESETAAVAELRLLRVARDALARHDHAGALAAAAEHAKRFPVGQLVEEREAIRVEALAGLGKRDETRRAAIAFRERFPKSVLLPTVERVLESTP